MSRNEIKAWLLFLILNSILFLPRYLIEIETTDFFPDGLSFKEEDFGTRQLFFRRNNYDIFRLSVDILLIFTIFIFLRRKLAVRATAFISGIYYVLLLLFLTYYGILSKIYIVSPLILSDLSLLRLVFYNVGTDNLLLISGSAILLISFIYLSFLVFSTAFKIIRNTHFSGYSISLLVLLWLFYLQGTIRSGMTFMPNHVIQFSGALLADNINLSVQSLKSRNNIDFKEAEKQLRYNNYNLSVKPPVNLIFLESYGDILNRKVSLNKSYHDLLQKCDSGLSSAGWYSCSALSTSTTAGGKSWLAYTSVILGSRIDNQGYYQGLLKDKECLGFTHLLRYLNGQGYKNYWLNALPNRKEMTIPWQAYTDFYEVDVWIKDEDLNYAGERYGFGPSPPDQYSLFYARELILEKKSTPRLLVYLTQNTHSPFHSPELVASDWKMLNKTVKNHLRKPDFLRYPDDASYLKAVSYSLRMLTDFITKDTTQKAIYILIGDHQPPIITGSDKRFETPVHIITRDSAFLKYFNEYGFIPGLTTADCTETIKHEALFSVLLREIYRNYGDGSKALPKYFPDGIKISRP